ncbi:MAG: hypothetical protein MUP63_04395 [Candidatus Nanohaloarchaeota archaeon QJJ-7]|nr:hypothetical protein [Candidatus Nanohaloarchaeota archaeon QJJ-7]
MVDKDVMRWLEGGIVFLFSAAAGFLIATFLGGGASFRILAFVIGAVIILFIGFVIYQVFAPDKKEGERLEQEMEEIISLLEQGVQVKDREALMRELEKAEAAIERDDYAVADRYLDRVRDLIESGRKSLRR